jgi:hypothetical protein
MSTAKSIHDRAAEMTEPTHDHGHTDDIEAALDSVEPERLLPGEAADTPYPDDAQHWIKVYSELVAFKVDILSITEERMHGMDPDSGAEVAATDFKVLRAEEQRLKRRLAFWRARAVALEQP